jgi:hypothetical protein
MLPNIYIVELESETFQKKCFCPVLELHPIRHDVVIAKIKRLNSGRIFKW